MVSSLRAVERKKPEGPLVIAPLKNRDWREVARKRRTTERFVPGAGKAATGADGSVGGLGTRGSINSGPQLVGLQKRVKREHDGDMDIDSAPNSGFATPAEESGTESVKKEDTESEEQRALRALLKGATGDGDDAFAIPAIPINPLSEEEALRQDVAELPEESSLADYERVPVSQFGAAMLRGMGWKPEVEQKSTGKAGRRPAQPWVPEQRPALLGIGAKEREVLDDGGPKKFMGGKKAQMKYMPLVKREREGSSSGGDRDRGDRSRDEKDSRVSGRDERDRDGDRREGRERDYSSSDRDRDRGKDRRESRDDRNIHGRRDRDQDSDRGHDDRDRRRDTRRDDVRRDYDKRDRRADERGSDGYRSRDGKRDRSRERDRRR